LARVEQLELELERLRSTLDGLVDAVIVTDRLGFVDYMNPAAEELTGFEAERAYDCDLQEILPLRDGEVDAEGAAETTVDLTPCLQDGQRLFIDDVALHRADGRVVPIEGRASAVRRRDGAGTIVGAVLLLHDTSHRLRRTRSLQRAAAYDTLTGLLKREAFSEHLQRALTSSSSSDDKRGALLLLDLDQLQVINDSCGNAAGDHLIQWVASLVRERLRDADILARVGGDEFAILVPDSHLEAALKLADEIHSSLRNFRFVWQDRSFSVGASIGAVPLAQGAELTNPADFLDAAEKACSLAKEQGRSQTQIYRRDADELRARASLAQWAVRLRQALDEDEFVLYWQRIQPLGTRSVERPLFFEILLRLKNSDGSIALPGEFLPAAERFDLSRALDRWVVRASFARLAALPGDFLAELDACSINLSGASIGDRAMLEFIEKELERTGCPPERVVFEITETAAVANLHRAVEMIEALRLRGCRWALDDFGSGVASYRYLSELPVDFIKIDGKIVSELMSSPLSWTMVRSIHEIAHVMGAKTIAERIQDAELLAELEKMGIDFGQGFFIEKPRPIEVRVAAGGNLVGRAV
jgi:diguanylate cyclase (GGDEF)-like protein/PAS domain S-box-containing protein